MTSLAEQVRRYWIEGVLNSVAPAVRRISIRCIQREDLVANPFADLLNRNMAEPRRYAVEDTDPTALFQQRGGGLLLLGEAGSGKTVSLLQLAEHLLLQHESNRTEPLPIVLHLAGWQRGQRDFADWILTEISKRYRIPRRMTRDLMANGRLAFLLDGLDEVPADCRAGCAIALRDWVNGTEEAVFALCCRRADYERLPVRIPVRSAATLLPLSDDDIQSYLSALGAESGTGATPRMQAGMTGLERTPLMAKVVASLSTPRPAGNTSMTPSAPPLDDTDALLGAYVEELLRRCPPARATPEHRDALPLAARVGERLVRDGRAQFDIESIDQRWFPNPWQRRAYELLFGALLGLIVGLTLAVFWGLVTPILDVRNLGCDAPHLPDGSCVAMRELLLLWLIVPPLWGLLLILLDPRLPQSEASDTTMRRVARTVLPVALAYLACWMLLCMAALGIFGSTRPPGPAWTIPLWLSGISISLLVASWRAQRNELTGPVRSVETLRWRAGRGLVGAGYALIAGLTLWIINALAGGAWLPGTLPAFLLIGVGIGLLLGGLQPGLPQGSARANQGIYLSLRNALFAAGVGALAGALLGAASGYLIWRLYSGYPTDAAWEASPQLLDFVLRYTFADMIALASISALWLGGAEVAKHALLRGMLALDGCLPIALAERLDAACEIGLMQRVGSGWIFSHRLLAEHLAVHRQRYESVT